MKRYERILIVALLALFGTVIAGWVLTRPAPSSGSGQGTSQPGAPGSTAPAASQATVDQQPFLRAQQLASLAGSPQEQNLSRLAITLADQELDLAFAAALRNAANHPAPLRQAAQHMQQHVQEVTASVAADKSTVARLGAQVAQAGERRKEQVSMQLELAQAQQALDEDQLADAQEDLARAGGDPQRDIQQQMAEHEASQQHVASANMSTDANTGTSEATAPAAVTATASASPTLLAQPTATTPHNIVALVGSWDQLRSGERDLRTAQQDALARVAMLTRDHEQLDQEVSSEEPKRSALTQQAVHDLATGGQGAEQTAADALTSVHHLADDQKNLADFDKRIQATQRLSNVYSRWADQVASRRTATLHSLLWYMALVVLIALITEAAEVSSSTLFARVEPERSRLHTLRAVARFFVRATGFLLILLVIFGPPGQLATVLALAGAGLTVALKDFIVGFFGWFVLLGSNGIRAGDWVEINGVPGEVLEVGLFHTLLLETGDMSGGSHPTGRKVTFVNSFAIEGHYFNFTTAGRWIWDELQVSIPSDSDPFPIAEAIQKLAERETEGNAKAAEQDWQLMSGKHQPSFSAKPTLSVKPDSKGAMISVRYLTGAAERHALSERLYRGVVQLLRERKIPEPASTSVPTPEAPPAPAAAG